MMDKELGFYLASQMFVAASVFAPTFSKWVACITLAIVNLVAIVLP